MESITLLFVTGLVIASVLVTLLVRKDILNRDTVERARRRERVRRAGGR